MNQRIQELAEQAGMTRILDEHAHEYGAGMFENTPYPELEKFAELIVKECALVAKTLPHTPERHWVQDSVTYIPVHCEQNILKHFGVKA